MLVKDKNSELIQPGCIVNRIQAGEKDAEQELVNKYWRSLFFILQKRSQNSDLAADITQDTFLIVIEKARSGAIKNPNALAAFIRQTGVNLLIANFRKEHRRQTDTNSDIQHLFADVIGDTSEQVHFSKLTELVEQVINELPTVRDRDLLKQFYLYHQDKQVICQSLELTPTHFDRVLFRARNRLKDLLIHKLKVDVSSKGISQILLWGLVIYSLQLSTNDSTRIYDNYFIAKVRAPEPSVHNNVKSECSMNLLQFKQFRNKAGNTFL